MLNEKFKLEVPLNASQVKGFKPDRAVKAIAYGSKGAAAEQVVKLDASGKGTASFTFGENPGSLKVALGPEKASAADLQHMQTISVTVPSSAWRDTAGVKLEPIIITPYYWDWWWRWCTDYTVTGRLLCADGTPVVGASVCAIDVDSWWWWTSEEQVGCATTAADGSFVIDFSRCCGWWPWWWWETREWLLDPYLFERISSAVKGDPKIKRLPRATPKPSLDVFNQILSASATGPRALLTANLPVQTADIAINPSELEPLRTKLSAILPREFPLPIWPWYPWAPWWDCSANLIFRATQNCNGATNTIVNETFADIHWNIASNFNINLTANDQACCTYSCTDPDDCPEGNCIVPSDICSINVGSIGGNIGASGSAAQVGLYSPGVEDRPFAGEVSFFGTFGSGVTADYYEFLYSTTGDPGTFTTPLPLAAISAFNRQVLTVLPGPVFTWVPVPFGPNTISDGTTNHYVTETIQHYVTNNGPQTWDDFTHDLLLELNSANVLANGTYYLQLTGWQRPGYTGNLTNPVVLPVCDPNPDDPATDNYWVVTLDNQAPLPTDPSGQPCGLHICTDQPISDILQVMVQHADGTSETVGGCGLVCVEDGDSLIIDVAAYDPDNFLDSYTLQLLYGTDESVNLLDHTAFTTWTLAGSPLAPSWAPAAVQTGPGYATALSQGAVSPVWGGGSVRLTVNASAAFPTLPCAYLLQLNVYKRPIVDCDPVDSDPQQNVSFQTFTVQVCPTNPS
jgi:hypothetical protein